MSSLQTSSSHQVASHPQSPLENFEERRKDVVLGSTDILSLAGLVSISHKLGISPSDCQEINKENVSSWINAASSALDNKLILEAYSTVLQGQIAIEIDGALPSYSRDAKRYSPGEIYLNSLAILLKALDRQQVDDAKAASVGMPSFFAEQTWTPEWKLAVDLAVAFRDSVRGSVSSEPVDIAPAPEESKKNGISFLWEEDRAAAIVLAEEVGSSVSLRGGVVSSVSFDSDHPWWSATTPSLVGALGFNFDLKSLISLKSVSTDKSALPKIKTRSVDSKTVEGTILSSEKYPDIDAVQVAVHFVVQPLPLLDGEERVKFIPVIERPKDAHLIDIVTAEHSTINRLLASKSEERTETVAMHLNGKVHPFEAVPSQNLGAWRADVAKASSPWIDHNILIATKTVIPGLHAEVLRDLLRYGIREADSDTRIEITAKILADYSTSDQKTLTDLVIERELLPAESREKLNQTIATEVAKKAKTSSALDSLSFYSKGADSFGAMKSFGFGSNERSLGSGFGGLHAGVASDHSLGSSKSYSGPEIDCDPMGEVALFVIMPTAIHENSDPQREAADWLAAFTREALGN